MTGGFLFALGEGEVAESGKGRRQCVGPVWKAGAAIVGDCHGCHGTVVLLCPLSCVSTTPPGWRGAGLRLVEWAELGLLVSRMCSSSSELPVWVVREGLVVAPADTILGTINTRRCTAKSTNIIIIIIISYTGDGLA